MADINLGHATAYGYARSKGFSGTEEEFAQLMANYGTVGQTATQAAQTATTKASEAASSASNAALSATNAANSAQEAADIVENIIDDTLTQEGKAADAKVTGDEINNLKDDLSNIWGTQSATITGTAEGSARAYVPLIKGRKYAYTNNTPSSVTVRLYKADGTGVTLSNNLVKNTTFYFTCDATDYVAIGGYFAQAGLCYFTSIDDGIYSIINDTYTSYLVNNNNYSEVLANANNTLPHSIYTIWGASSFTISNMPNNWSSYASPTILIDFSGNATGIRIQWILRGLGANAVIYTRSGYGSDFNDWRLVNEKIMARPLLTVGTGKDVETILDAGLYAKAHPNTNLHILVYGGTYDLISEFEAKYGADYFLSMTEGEYGVPAGYGETWEFAPDAQIVANYTGSNPNVLTSFCPFFFAQGGGNYDCTMIGANINATNVKYCIHDEMAGSSIPYVHRYENCEFTINQHNISEFDPAYSWTASRCIGGGLGKSGNIIINGCHFISNNESGNATCLSYHNSSAAGAKSSLTITNNYFNAGHTYANSANASTTSTLETKVILSNNSFGAAPDTSTKNMMVVYAWNNEIRT